MGRIFAALLGFVVVGSVGAPRAQALCTCMLRRQPPAQQRQPTPESMLLSDASLGVLMREGRRTVLTMRVDYQGPPEDFAMLVPVPEVLERGQVRTLEPGVIERLDRLSAPRLVEYWERNPCGEGAGGRDTLRARRASPSAVGAGAMADAVAEAAPRPPPVRIEASYAVDEYDVTILSAADSVGLLDWLRGAGYELPSRAEPILRSYIEQGTKFFLARVDGSRLALRNGRGRLAPLQFHYESDAFQLPIRLGLMNSPGQQDVVVLALSHRGRVAVANRGNAIVPTNLVLPAEAREGFAPFYAGLLDRVLETNPGAVITEFASDVRDDLTAADARELGADRIPSRNASGFTLTRLHYRYRDDQRPDDLVFTFGDPIGGGDGQPAADGELGPVTAQARLTNGFRARYAVLNRFEGPLACASPQRGRWGGPRPGEAPRPIPTDIAPAAALDATALGRLLGDQLAEAGLTVGERKNEMPAAQAGITDAKHKNELLAIGTPTQPIAPAAPTPSAGGCACGVGESRETPFGLGLILLAAALAGLRSRRALSRDARRAAPRRRARERASPDARSGAARSSRGSP